MNVFMHLYSLLTVIFCCTENAHAEVEKGNMIDSVDCAKSAARTNKPSELPELPEDQENISNKNIKSLKCLRGYKESSDYAIEQLDRWTHFLEEASGNETDFNDVRHSVSVPSNVDDLVSQNFPTSSVCLTAEDVLFNLNETVDPCDDFYSFACDGWLNRHTIPENKSQTNVFSIVQDDLDMKLRALLQKNLTGSEPEFIKKTKLMYDTCMDLESIENFGAEPLKKVLGKLGGWPVVESNKWNGSNFDWIDTLIACRNLGCDHDILLDLSVLADNQKKNHYIYLKQASLGMQNNRSLARGLKNNYTATYYKLMVKCAKLFGVDEATVKNELRKTLDFEITLANIPWLKYLNGLLVDKILENETLKVHDPDFFSKFADLITKTEKRVVANYMLWRVVLEFIPMLSKEWVDLCQEHKCQSNRDEELPRWKQCLTSIKGRLTVAISSFYVREYFKKEIKDGVSELVKYIRSEFNGILDETDWMDNQTKKQAKEKADAMKPYIGYPEELLNDTAVQELFQNLEIRTESYFENVMRCNKWTTDSDFSMLRKPYIRRQWIRHVSPIRVNAFYWFYENSIDITAGILQYPFFNNDRPHYMNFGAIGFIIGHEIAHGLGGESKHYDGEGNKVDWWSNATLDSFKAKTQCIIDQYSNYMVENKMNVNGNKTLHENMADYGGLKAAYLAYQSWLKNNREEELLPCLKFTQNQMFWISAANTFCGNNLPEEMKRIIESGVYSPFRFRIIGTMSNLPQFAKDFNCSPDSAMNKKEKCDIWGK